MHDDVGAVLERPAQIRRGERVVDDERQPGLARDGADRLDVEHVVERIADGLGVERLRLGRERAPEVFRIVGIDEVRGDAEAAQLVVELRVGAAVERARRHQLVARLHQRQQRRGLRRHARAHRQCRAAPFERRHALLEDGRRGIHHAAVDIAECLQVEQTGRMVGAVEDVGGSLVDRHGARAGSRIG